MWKLILKPGATKPSKVPFYASGQLRGWPKGKPRDGQATEQQPQVAQGDELDRACLVTFDAALERLGSSFTFDGVGFGFLPGDGLVGIDVDGAIDSATGEVSPMCMNVIEACASYTERSPSGRGVHVIAAGETESFKDNAIGLEVFCGSQFFTCTGDVWGGAPAEVGPLKGFALGYMRELVDASKARQAEEKRIAAAAAAPVRELRPAQMQGAEGRAGEDFRRVNAAALDHIDAWVRQLFPKARQYKQGWRVRSKDLGRDLEEDLQVMPEGIMDFGEGRGLSPIDLVVTYGHKTPRDALHWLAPLVGVQLTPLRASREKPPPLRLVEPEASEFDGPPADVGFDERPEPPPPPSEEGAAAQGDRPKRQRSKKAASTPPEGAGGGLIRLLANYRLIYGTDAVWDGEQRITMAVKNLRLLYGVEAVKMWLAHPDRRVVMQHHMVFEPGEEVPEDHVNLFDGLSLEAEPCDDAAVEPMLALLRHLCSESADTPQAIADVVDWVLKWLALPLQTVGAKLRTALVFHGPQGTGKNLFFDCVRAMYGKYGRMVGQTELDDKFNDWLSAKLMIIGNEVVTRQELFHNKNKLKWIVTEDEIPIRGMHQTVRWESNHAQVIFVSNEHQPVALEKDDRRHLVVYTPAAADGDLYLRVADFLARGGAAKFMYYLQRYDTDGFGEHTKPLMTHAKQVLIELGLKPAERFAEEWLEGLLPLPVRVCSAEQLYRVFRRWCEMNGEKWPPPQAQFTTTVSRHVKERKPRDLKTGERIEPRLTYKVVQLKDESGPRKAMRCWLPCGTGPRDGVSEGAWVAEAVDEFELLAARFGRSLVHEEEGE